VVAPFALKFHPLPLLDAAEEPDDRNRRIVSVWLNEENAEACVVRSETNALYSADKFIATVRE
jgi:hypothetical protein